MTKNEDGNERTSDDHWLVINGRRWRRTDPALPSSLQEELRSHLGKGRSGVRTAKAADDAEKLAEARRRVGLAKLGLGERGPYWWDRPTSERIDQARSALDQLAGLAGSVGDYEAGSQED